MTPVTVQQAIEVALAHHRAGRLADAEAIYRQVLAQVPDQADALQLLGILAGQTGNLEAALDYLGRAIVLEPARAEHHYNRGELLRRAGRWEEASAAFRRALELGPSLAQAHANLASVLHQQGRLDEAIAAYRRALELGAADPVIDNNLGSALNDIGALDQAIAALDRAIARAPGYADAHANLGVVLHRAQRLDESIAACRRAIALGANPVIAHNNLGNALRESGALDEAINALRLVLALAPGAEAIAAHDNLIVTLHFHPDYDAQDILAECRRWAARYANPLPPGEGSRRPGEGQRDRERLGLGGAAGEGQRATGHPGRRLRIGFVSPDFRAHPAGQLVLPLFEHRDRRFAEFVCYAEVHSADALTRRFQTLADGWRSTVGMSAERVAEQVRADRIDILVDLAVHTGGNRLLVFARKPAPVQVSMLGMPSTTGLETIDYRLTDAFFDPPGSSDGYYTETSIRLPRSIWCYEPPEAAPEVGPLPAARNGFVTFGCLNQFAKVSRPAVRAWIGILRALLGARLVLQSPPGSHLDPVRALFHEAGIAADRVAFVAKIPRSEYLKRYHELDLCLDPFPYNGHTSTFDALWMGVPVVTLAGRTGVGRAGVSLLSNVGLPELIAETPEQYVQIAVQLATDLKRLAAMRSGLRRRMETSPLMDGRTYAADVEAAFRSMWQTWCGG
jgi:predicted O-linked N-acetylglucosamine transferase (SPINDLY family)